MASAVLAAVGGLPEGPQPHPIPLAQRPALAAAVGAVGLIGFTVAGRLPMTGGTLAGIGALIVGVGLAFATHPVLAIGIGAVLLICAVVCLGTEPVKAGRRAVAVAGVVGVGIGLGIAAERLHDFYYGPTHPSSGVLGPPRGTVRWVWSGGVTSTTGDVVAKVNGDAAAIGLIVDPPAQVRAIRTSDATTRFRVHGLRAGTRYRYAVTRGGQDDRSGRGEFTTLPQGPATFTVAVSSCARSGSNGVVFDAIRAERPLLYLNVGDLFYANIERDDPAAFQRAYDRALTRPAQANLARSTASAYVWDDHDFAGNDGDGTSRSRPAASKVYREYVPNYPLALPGSQAPLAQAFTVGRARFIVTDTRSARRATGPDRTILGAEQRRWFVRELVAARDRYPVIIWVSPVSWMGAPDPESDGWAGFDRERRYVADLIAQSGVRDRLVMVSGDTHAVALDDGTNSDFSTSRRGGFPVLHAGALDREPVPGRSSPPYSHGVFPGGGRYGLIEVADRGGDTVRVTLRGRTWDGAELTRLTRTFPVPRADTRPA